MLGPFSLFSASVCALGKSFSMLHMLRCGQALSIEYSQRCASCRASGSPHCHICPDQRASPLRGPLPERWRHRRCMVRAAGLCDTWSFGDELHCTKSAEPDAISGSSCDIDVQRPSQSKHRVMYSEVLRQTAMLVLGGISDEVCPTLDQSSLQWYPIPRHSFRD